MRVLLADDEALIRRGLTMLLSTVDGVEVVAAAHDGAEALAHLEQAPVDIVLTDARMRGMDGVALVRAIARHHPGVPVIVLTTFDLDDLVLDAVEAGAAGFLLKDTDPDDIVAAMERVLAGGMALDPRVVRTALRGRASRHDPLEVLTPTERAVAEMVSTGATNQEIAEHLCLAQGTVKNTVSALLRKLDQRDRTGLALYLVEQRAASARWEEACGSDVGSPTAGRWA